MKSSRNSFQHTAVAALAGLTIGLIATNALAAVRLGGPPVDNTGPVTNADGLEIPVVLEGEGGSNTNDVFDPINPPPPTEVPNTPPAAIAASLSASDTDMLCRDVDYFLFSNLKPLTDYSITISGKIADKMGIGWFDNSGNLILLGSSGVLLGIADANGQMIISTSSLDDMNFDGLFDFSANPHGVCGNYILTVELFDPPAPGPLGDVNGDALVDIDDVRVVLSAIGSTEAPNADLTRDGIVDEQDLRILADVVTEKRARKLADKKATKIEKNKRKAEKRAKKLADKAARKAARRSARGR